MTLKQIGQILERLERKVDAHDKKFDQIDIKINDLREEQLHQSVLLESLDDEFKTLGEAVVDTMKLKLRADKHGDRISKLEGDSKLTKSVVSIHSGRLKSQGA